MLINYCISETKPIHLGLYRLCFSQKEFCDGYDISIFNSELNAIITKIALTPYRDVRRYVLLYKSKPISFCHFQLKEKLAIASGGISPEHINSGKGLYAAAIFYDFYFKTFPINELVVEIKYENLVSIRMHKAIGFIECRSEKKAMLKISRNEFPNKFTSKLLSKIKYESK